jgi:murein DD-endopeptidase MepM/ murein hydrolase activator NlpD
VTRQITVADRDFGRGLVFLDPAHYALITQRAAIARDARNTRQILASESPEQRWSGAWRNPAAGAKSSPYGIERFYFRASDSTRSITLSPGMKTTFGFGEDTSTVAPRGAIGWRHTGVDIPFSRGAAVHASAAGVVTDVGTYILTGNTVIVDHGQGVHTAYFHLDTVTVRPGETVKTGSMLGRVGATGLTTGPHLHYGVYIHGRDVDPVLWHQLPRAALDLSGAPTRQ